jgi:hypothetical protein
VFGLTFRWRGRYSVRKTINRTAKSVGFVDFIVTFSEV